MGLTLTTLSSEKNSVYSQTNFDHRKPFIASIIKGLLFFLFVAQFVLSVLIIVYGIDLLQVSEKRKISVLTPVTHHSESTSQESIRRMGEHSLPLVSKNLDDNNIMQRTNSSSNESLGSLPHISPSPPASHERPTLLSSSSDQISTANNSTAQLIKQIKTAFVVAKTFLLGIYLIVQGFELCGFCGILFEHRLLIYIYVIMSVVGLIFTIFIPFESTVGALLQIAWIFTSLAKSSFAVWYIFFLVQRRNLRRGTITSITSRTSYFTEPLIHRNSYFYAMNDAQSQI